MKRQKNIFLWFGKLFLVFLMVFSQVQLPIVVLAEELDVTNDTEDVILDKEEDNTESEDNSNALEEDDNSNDTLEEEKEEGTLVSEENNNNDNSTDTDTVVDETAPDNNDNVVDETVLDNNDNNVADETTTNEENSYSYVVTVNGEEVEEYTLNDGSTSVAIYQEYGGEDGTYHFSQIDETIDFTNMLYGDYEFNYSVLNNEDEVLDSKTIVIHYGEYNAFILDQFNQECGISIYNIGLPSTNSTITVNEVLEKFDLEGLSNQYSARIYIKDENGNVIEGDSVLAAGSKLVLTNDIVEEEFSLWLFYDINNDMVLDIEDAKLLVDSILNGDYTGEDGITYASILDATNSAYFTGVVDQYPEVFDTLTNTLINRTNIYIGEEVEVKYYINGFNNDYLNGISGKINYNKDILELVDVTIDSIHGGINQDGNFMYLLDNYHSDDVLMTIRFKGIAAGEANVSIEEVIGSVLGSRANLEDSVFTTITVEEAGVGGDVPPETVTTDNDVSSVVVPVVDDAKVIALSSDSKIKSLKIKGYSIEFDPNIYDYSIKVKNSVKSLNLNIVLSDPNASYEVFGNSNFKVGNNDVSIVVTAEDGSTSTYTIHVDRAKATDEEDEDVKDKEEKNTSRGIIIALIVLVIIGLIYVIFKDDEEDNN